MARVYLSHSRTNDRDTALRLRDALNDRGHDVFLDTNILHYGSEWGVGLLNMLMSADGVLALPTPTSLGSHHVLTEVGAALAGRRRDPNKLFCSRAARRTGSAGLRSPPYDRETRPNGFD